jgi:hypothetical protein
MTPRERLLTRRSALAALFGGAAAAGCAHDGHLGIFGYTTAPNYDPEIRTVYVPVFRTKVFSTTPYRDMEMTLTRKVQDAIEWKTPMKVLSDKDGADTELQGTVVAMSKVLTNRTSFNEVRELALYISCEIVWFDLRPGHEGKILTNPRQRDLAVPPIGGFQFDPDNPPQPPKPDTPRPVVISANGRAMPEVGETSTTALNMCLDRLSVKIVSAMEQPW